MGACASRNFKKNAAKTTQSDNSQSAKNPKLTRIRSKTILKKVFRQLEHQSLRITTKLRLNYSGIPNINHKGGNDDQNSASSATTGLIGFTNQGNNCFMNSALQCLFNIPPLADYFLNDLYVDEINLDNPGSSRGAITLSFAHLLKQYWTRSDLSEINPKELSGVILRFGPQFSKGTQQDSHEFLVFLLDKLHEDLNRVKEKLKIEEKDYTGDHFEEYASESWRNYLSLNKSVIVDLFQGQSKSTLKCMACGHKSHKFEPFMYLSLPIPGNDDEQHQVSLIECMKEYSKEERLKFGERWSCPQCRKLTEGTKKLEIWKLPNILLVHLKRFQFCKQFNGKKICRLVDFPIVDLDLSPIVQGYQRDKPIYDLLAVSNHQGELSSGHCFTFAKNREDQAWYSFNDSEVVKLKKENIVSSSGYVLFFCKTSTDKFRRQSLTIPEAWPHPVRESRLSLMRSSTMSSLLDQKNESKPEQNSIAGRKEYVYIPSYPPRRGAMQQEFRVMEVQVKPSTQSQASRSTQSQTPRLVTPMKSSCTNEAVVHEVHESGCKTSNHRNRVLVKNYSLKMQKRQHIEISKLAYNTPYNDKLGL